jgi:PAS domain S-box-containing protein
LCTLLGYTEAELLGRTFKEVTHPDDVEDNMCRRSQLMRGEIKSFDMEKRYIRKDGGIVWVYLNVSVVSDEKENPIHCLGYIRDITERKRAEEALRQSEEWLRLAAEGSQLGIWHWDEVTQELTWDATTREMFGVPAEAKVTLDTFYGTVHPDDRERFRKTWREALEAGLPYKVELRAQRADGSVRWIHGRGKGYYGAAGNPVRMIGVVFDVTERKLAEEELHKALMEVRRLKGQLELDNVYLREELSQTHRYGEIVGESDGIKKVFEQVEQVALTDMTVLILGETGTGKELVARLVHGKSGRGERPLVKVNCSTLPAELIESELFGHERGAFTGAVAKQVGRFELADGGTIFLDEVGELPLGLQAKLLRVLQDGEFERLGSGKTIKVNVRVIAATNRNLREAAQRGRFRDDLYYRLNVYPIEIPPLRERRGDIGLLAQVFLQEAGRRLGKSFGTISKETIEALRAYNWPGNVRELENVIARASIISTAPTLQLPEGWNRSSSKAGFAEAMTQVGEQSHIVASEGRQASPSLAEFERTRILEVLYQTNWRIEGPKGAALILGLHPNTLRSRLRKLGIIKPPKPRNFVVETTK